MKNPQIEFYNGIGAYTDQASMDELEGMSTALGLVSALLLDTHARMVKDQEHVPAYAFEIQHAIVAAYSDAVDAACSRIQDMHTASEGGANR